MKHNQKLEELYKQYANLHTSKFVSFFTFFPVGLQLSVNTHLLIWIRIQHKKKLGSDPQKCCNTTANLVSNNAAAGTMEDDVENRFFATRQLRLIQLAKQLTHNRQDYLKKTMGNN